MANETKYRVAMSATFDVENYGDLLFPLLAEHELSKRLGKVEVVPFSYNAKDRGSWAYDVTSLTEFASTLESFDAVIIGGGHIVRFDKFIAEGYGPPSSAIHHPTGYWLSPAVAAIAASVPVIWNAPSSSPEIPRWAEAQLRIALEQSAYVSVRDERSRAVLTRVAPNAKIVVAPDTAFGLARLLRDGNVSHPPVPTFTAPYLVCHASEAIRPLVEAVRDDERFAGFQLVEIPIGPILDDRVGLLSNDGRREFSIEGWTHPLEIAALVAGSSGVLTRSLHLSISALAFGKPVMVSDLPENSKYALLARSARVFVGTTPEGRERFAMAARVDELCAVGLAGAAETSAHWDRVADEIVRGKDGARTRTAIYDQLFDAPTHLEREEALADTNVALRERQRADREEVEALVAARDGERDQRVRLEGDLGASRATIDRLEAELHERAVTIERLEVLLNLLRSQADAVSRSTLVKLSSRLEPLHRRLRGLVRANDRDEDVRLVRASGLFDPAAYRALAGEVAPDTAGLIAHYLAAPVVGPGPCPRFDAAHYLATNRDVATSGMHPIVHYLRFGAVEGRAPRSTGGESAN